MSDVVKSIFRRKEVEKIYEINRYCNRYFSLDINYLDVTMNVRVNEDNVISDKEIGSYDIEIPMLEVGDEFFLHDIQEVVVIKNRMRSSDGSITYYVEDKLVETENTKRSKEECDKTMKEFKEVRERFEKYAKKYKYEHRFFNLKCAEETFSC